MNTMRKEFEGWVIALPCELRSSPLKLDPDTGEYWNSQIEFAWITWRARQAEIDALKEKILLLEGDLYRAMR